MSSENPIGADNQQGSRQRRPNGDCLTPQRLHAELLATGAKGLEAYLQGALRDGTRSALHNTHRFGQSDQRWLDVLAEALVLLGSKSWSYREGSARNYWVLETSAAFLDVDFDARPLVGTSEGLAYVRGFFDAEGGMPRSEGSRLYLQLSQKSRESLETLVQILESWAVHCGRIHNPSASVDPHYWRFYIKACSQRRYMALVSSWHPRKRRQMTTRMVR
jgi:hypothetical protein